MTQQQLADRLGITQGYVARMIRGDRSGGEKIDTVAEVLGVDARWLRFGDDACKPAWALDSETLTGLTAITKSVREAKGARDGKSTREDVVALLRAILDEQRRIRSILEERDQHHKAADKGGPYGDGR